MSLSDFFGNLSYAYTRADALADGTLVDASELARQCGYKVPVAFTREAWARCIEVPRGVLGQDETGRLWDVLYVLRQHMLRTRNSSEPLLFEVFVRNDNAEPRLVMLKAILGPGDAGEPVLTVMLPHQD